MELKMASSHQGPKVIPSSDEAAASSACARHGLLPAELARLRAHAAAAKANAHCPYSNFRVGAALLLPAEAGREDELAFVRGVNVENASYPVGTCAERAALANAVTAGYRSFRALGVATDVSPPASPCGMCRQFIREFCDLKMPIFMFDKNDDFVVMTLEELLPMSFGPDQLPKPGPSA